MNTTDLLEAIRGRAVKNKEFAKAIDALETSDALGTFVANNQDLLSALRPSQVADFLLVAVSSLLDKNVQLTIAKNVYDEYSVIFVLCLLTTTSANATRNKITRIFRDVIAHSSKFDMYNLVKNRHYRMSADDKIIELFWLIPLFVNAPVLANLDVEEFIGNNEDVKTALPDYAEGYENYVTGSILAMDKIAYKSFLREGVVTAAELAA
jgi:hypothetical protein